MTQLDVTIVESTPDALAHFCFLKRAHWLQPTLRTSSHSNHRDSNQNSATHRLLMDQSCPTRSNCCAEFTAKLFRRTTWSASRVVVNSRRRELIGSRAAI